MPINTMINLKTRFERKEVYKISGLFRCNFPQCTRLDFCATDLFPGTFIDFCFTDVAMKDLAHMLILVCKLFDPYT